MKGTKHFKFIMRGYLSVMKGEGVLLEASSDADYTADKTNHKSVSDSVLMVVGMILGWQCKKQK